MSLSKRSKAHTRYKLVDGTPVPGVTTVLNILAKPALIPWANRMGLQGIDVGKYVDEKARIGTLAHAIIAAHWTGEKADTADYSQREIDQAENSVLSYFEWEKGKTLEPLLVETPLVHGGHGFGGTPDFVGRIDGEMTLLDLKTGKAIYTEAVVQCGAYALLQPHRPVSATILQIGRDETEGFSIRHIGADELERAGQFFLKVLEVYRLKQVLDGSGAGG